jgi:hypothetical protein
MKNLALLVWVGVSVACSSPAGPGGAGSSGTSGGSSGGGGGEITTKEQLGAAAPFEWEPSGEAASFEGVNFLVPPGWKTQAYADGFALRSPDAIPCEIWILQPRPAASGDAQYTQLVNAAKGLLPPGSQTVLGQYSDDALSYRTRGTSGTGWPFVGLNVRYVQSNGSSGKPFMAIFGDTAVPVIPIVPPGSKCLDYYSGNDVVVPNIWYSLSYDGAQITNESNYPQAVVGTWFVADTSVGVVHTYAMNGEFFSAYRSEPKGFDPMSGSASETYKVIDDALAVFPKAAGEPGKSNYIRIIEEANTSAPSGWTKTLCSMTRSTVEDKRAYESCFNRSE